MALKRLSQSARRSGFPCGGKSTGVAMGEEPGAALNRINPTCRMMRQVGCNGGRAWRSIESNRSQTVTGFLPAVAMGEEPGAALNRMYCTQIQLQFRIVKTGEGPRAGRSRGLLVPTGLGNSNYPVQYTTQRRGAVPTLYTRLCLLPTRENVRLIASFYHVLVATIGLQGLDQVGGEPTEFLTPRVQGCKPYARHQVVVRPRLERTILAVPSSLVLAPLVHGELALEFPDFAGPLRKLDQPLFKEQGQA